MYTKCPGCAAPQDADELTCPKCGVTLTGSRYAKPGVSSRAVHNPYAPPASNLEPEVSDAGEGVWRRGKVLILRHGSKLPHRCVTCNEPAAQRLPRKLYWHQPWIYVFIFVNALLYVLIGLAARRKALVEVPLCAEHIARNRRGIRAAWAAGLLGVVVPFAGGALAEASPAFGTPIAGLALLSLLLIPVGILMGLRFSQPVVPQRIDRDYIWLRRCSEKLLATLPEAPPI